MTKILAIRPEPGLSSTLEAARSMELDIAGQPLFEIRPVAWECPAPDTVDALLIGSANAILHGGNALEMLRGKKVHAVGKATATAAREAGFEVASIGSGGLQNVLDAIRPPCRLLRIAGAEHVPLRPPAGVEIRAVIAYESNALPFKPAVNWQDGDAPVVLLHSAAAAHHFACECDRLDLKRSGLTLAVLGPRIAEATGQGWRAVHISAQPNDGALLEMVQDICK